MRSLASLMRLSLQQPERLDARMFRVLWRNPAASLRYHATVLLAKSGSGRREGLVEVGDQVVYMLDANRQSDHVFRYPCTRQLFRGELAMGR